ncbi:hypothetical protein MN608_06602 [Microdochium nivale]|nr:hypothetical protein MN608_06602 [Microdochium nivale]
MDRLKKALSTAHNLIQDDALTVAFNIKQEEVEIKLSNIEPVPVLEKDADSSVPTVASAEPGEAPLPSVRAHEKAVSGIGQPIQSPLQKENAKALERVESPAAAGPERHTVTPEEIIPHMSTTTMTLPALEDVTIFSQIGHSIPAANNYNDSALAHAPSFSEACKDISVQGFQYFNHDDPPLAHEAAAANKAVPTPNGRFACFEWVNMGCSSDFSGGHSTHSNGSADSRPSSPASSNLADRMYGVDELADADAQDDTAMSCGGNLLLNDSNEVNGGSESFRHALFAQNVPPALQQCLPDQDRQTTPPPASKSPQSTSISQLATRNLQSRPDSDPTAFRHEDISVYHSRRSSSPSSAKSHDSKQCLPGPAQTTESTQCVSETLRFRADSKPWEVVQTRSVSNTKKQDNGAKPYPRLENARPSTVRGQPRTRGKHMPPVQGRHPKVTQNGQAKEDKNGEALQKREVSNAAAIAPVVRHATTLNWRSQAILKPPSPKMEPRATNTPDTKTAGGQSGTLRRRRSQSRANIVQILETGHDGTTPATTLTNQQTQVFSQMARGEALESQEAEMGGHMAISPEPEGTPSHIMDPSLQILLRREPGSWADMYEDDLSL